MIPGNTGPQEYGGIRPGIERNHVRSHDRRLKVRLVVALEPVFRPAEYAVGQLVPHRGGHGVEPGPGLRIILRRGYQEARQQRVAERPVEDIPLSHRQAVASVECEVPAQPGYAAVTPNGVAALRDVTFPVVIRRVVSRVAAAWSGILARALIGLIRFVGVISHE